MWIRYSNFHFNFTTWDTLVYLSIHQQHVVDWGGSGAGWKNNDCIMHQLLSKCSFMYGLWLLGCRFRCWMDFITSLSLTSLDVFGSSSMTLVLVRSMKTSLTLLLSTIWFALNLLTIYIILPKLSLKLLGLIIPLFPFNYFPT